MSFASTVSITQLCTMFKRLAYLYDFSDKDLAETAYDGCEVISYLLVEQIAIELSYQSTAQQ